MLCRNDYYVTRLLFFHGGAWAAGARGAFRRQAVALTDQSRLVVFSADYPLNRDPVEATRAAQAAICWIRKNATMLSRKYSLIGLR